MRTQTVPPSMLFTFKSSIPSNNSYSSRCLARRQLPLTIEQDLTMIMALDDACLACCSSTLFDVDEKTSNEINSNMATFTRKYQALNRYGEIFLKN